jgi:ribosomal protein S18 acetylase RimI-like enzyme
MVPARSEDLGRYLDLLEEVAVWLEARGISQWPAGQFRLSADSYAESIRQEEVQLALVGDALVGALQLLLRERMVWAEAAEDDAVYVFSLAVRRAWAKHEVGRQMLDWAGDRATTLGRRYIRLDCEADNQFLRAYYESAGFEDRGEFRLPGQPARGTRRLRRYQKDLVAHVEPDPASRRRSRKART